MADPHLIGEFFLEALETAWSQSGQRWPLLRTGAREPIPAHVRAAVWYRDGGLCAHCASGVPVEFQPWHLDHIIPWSAGGPDDSTNLRVLCERHNLDRSNQFDPFAHAKIPVTWWCTNCFADIRELDDDGFPIDGPGQWAWAAGRPIRCPLHLEDERRCRVIAAHARHLQRTHELMDPWHQRDAITDPTVFAYCAHCDTYALTDMAL